MGMNIYTQHEAEEFQNEVVVTRPLVLLNKTATVFS